ncbi:MAG TPA: histidine kinase dimerization/phospho-acceptor domain-containing protein [Actinomycetota bacterium]|nr:histidine kinase dimerization/phospho-acceptor domain-containing protein [Actinomycetota bacterium]
MDDQHLADLISKLAHDLRSPLTALQGFSKTLVSKWDRFDDGQRRELVETIHTEAERMERVIAEAVALARAELGEGQSA